MIPTEPVQITVEWLADVLRGEVPGDGGLETVEVVDWNAGTTGRARLRLSYSNGMVEPVSLFAKLPPSDELQQAMVQATGMGRREVLFYRDLAGEVPVRVPRPYFADANDDGTAYLMLLEDLAESGCGFPTISSPGAPARVERVAASLARLHASYWNSERFAADLSWVEPPMRHEIGPTLVKRGLDDFGAEMPAAFREMADVYISRTDDVCDLWEEGEQTLCHGDCHVGNQFDDGSTPGFLDWAVLCRAPGVRDLSYFLANSIPVEMRRDEEAKALQRYRADLAECIDDPPSADALSLRYARLVGYAWVAAVTTMAMGDKWQAFRHAKEAVGRANQALADLRTVDVLREGLR